MGSVFVVDWSLMTFVLRSWQLFFLIQIIDPGGEVVQEIGSVECRDRLGGTLRYYYRDAA